VEYLRLSMNGEDLVLRDLGEQDIETFVSYWHDSPEEYLDFLSVDRQKLGSREDTRARFRRSIRNGTGGQERVALVCDFGEQVIGYTNLHFVGPDETYIHAHIVNPDLRDLGIASFLLVHVLGVVFREFGVSRLLIQTRPTNTRINHVLEKFGLEGSTRYVGDPDGLPHPGEFCVYEVEPAHLGRLAEPVSDRAA
jgi:RimJ/RimL family protein N-acetyltransferase